MKNRPFSFSKSERLKSKKEIETLFQSGEAFFVFPFKVYYRILPATTGIPPAQWGISVPKKKHRKAHTRNRIKRLTREAYRLQKSDLYTLLNEKQLRLSLLFVFTSPEDLTFPQSLKRVAKVFERLQQSLTGLEIKPDSGN